MSEEQEVKPKGKKAKHAPSGAETAAVDAAPKAPRDRTSRNFDKAAVIVMLTDKNPKREGSKAHGQFGLYKEGITVETYIANGGSYGNLAWDAARGFISIAGYTPKAVVKKEKVVKEETAAA